MREKWVRFLVQEDPTCCRATGLCPTTIDPRAWDPHLLKPSSPRAQPQQQENRTLQIESSPHVPKLEKSPHSNKDPAQPKINTEIIF